MSTPVRAVIFDIGGVLAYDVWEHLFLDPEAGLAARYGMDRDKLQRIGKSLWTEFAYERPAERPWQEEEVEYWQTFARQTGVSAAHDELIALSEKFVRPVDGMTEVLERLRSQAVPLALCSNNTEFWFQRQWQKLNLDRYVIPRRVILSSRVGAAKKNGEFDMFKAAVASLGLKAVECLFVDDRPENIQHALEFGLGGVLFPDHADYGAKYITGVLERMNVL